MLKYFLFRGLFFGFLSGHVVADVLELDCTCHSGPWPLEKPKGSLSDLVFPNVQKGSCLKLGLAGVWGSGDPRSRVRKTSEKRSQVSQKVAERES